MILLAFFRCIWKHLSTTVSFRSLSCARIKYARQLVSCVPCVFRTCHRHRRDSITTCCGDVRHSGGRTDTRVCLRKRNCTRERGITRVNSTGRTVTVEIHRATPLPLRRRRSHGYYAINLQRTPTGSGALIACQWHAPFLKQITTMLRAIIVKIKKVLPPDEIRETAVVIVSRNMHVRHVCVYLRQRKYLCARARYY